jgi:hypothetical protein
VAGHELRRVLEHVDEAVQFAQDVVGDVLAGARLAVDVDRDVGVLEADLLDELAQVQHRRVELGPGRELLVVDAQDEGAGAALLLRELAQVAVAGGAQHLEALLLDGLGQRADAEARGVLGAEVLVDDDDGEAEAEHRRSGPSGRAAAAWAGKCAKCRARRDDAPRVATLRRASPNEEQDGLDWNAPTWWWLAAGALVAAELATGTFYLLMLALGCAAGALAAHAGAGATAQVVVAALLGGGATVAWHLQARPHPGGPGRATRREHRHRPAGARSPPGRRRHGPRALPRRRLERAPGAGSGRARAACM